MDVSILIICHHDRGYLQEAIDSAKAQDFKGTFEIVLQMSDMTMAQNTNAGVRQCKGDYIKWLHDDDILLPDCLSNLFGIDADVVCANAYNFWQAGEEYTDDNMFVESRVPDSLQDMINHYQMHGSGLLYKRSVLLDNPLDETLLTGEEFELNLRLYSLGYKFVHIDKVVSHYRIHSQMKSFSAYGPVQAKRKADRKAVLESIRERYRTK